MRKFREIIALCLLALVSVADVSAADTRANANVSVRMSDRNITVAKAFSEIERQTGYIFAINNSSFDTSRSVNIPDRAMPLSEMLNLVLAGTGHTYSIIGNHIIIKTDTREPEKQAAPVPVPVPVHAPYRQAPPARQPEFRQEEPKQPRPIVTPAPEQPAPVVAEAVKPQYRFKGDDVVLRTPGDRIGKDGIPGLYMSPESNARPRFALKTNFVYWATLTPNLGVEVGLGKRTTINLFGGYNPWNWKGSEDNNSKLVHFIVQPEFRFWTCERFNGHNFGVNMIFSQYNIGGKTVPLLFEPRFRYEGYAWGAGVSYGYHWMLSPRLGLEFSAGVGVLSINYKKYDCAKCGDLVEDAKKIYFGPTKAAISLVFLIK